MKTSKDYWLGPLVVILVFIFHYGIQKSIYKISDSKQDLVIDFALNEVSQKVGIDFQHHVRPPAPQFSNVQKWITAFSSSVAVFDANNDGFHDIFFNDSSIESHHALFINNGEGGFINRSKEFGLDKIISPSAVTRGVSLDCNNDGYEDLVLFSNCPQLLVNQKGKFFTDFTNESGVKQCSFSTTAANVFDYDNDGNLDLIWGSYFANDIYSKSTDTDHGIMPENFMDSRNYSPIYLMKGDGKCHFKDSSNELPRKDLRGWYFSIGVQDIFKNNRQDIFIASDYGVDVLLKQNIKTNSWIDKSRLVDHASVSRNGMGVDFADITHELEPHMFVSNIFQEKEKVSGNLMWKYFKSENHFEEVGHKFKTSNCGWAWGAKFIDLNMDGWEDLVVANGFFGDGTSDDYWYNLSVLDSAGTSVMSKLKNWPDMKNYDLMGGERDCIFINRGASGEFSEVSTQTVFDIDKKNGRGVAYVDINNNGKYHLVVSNQNDRAKVYEITPQKPFNWIGLKLRGVKSNINGIGAKIFWNLSDGTKSYKELRPHNGFSSQSDPRFHLGFSKELSLSELYILWPSGIKQSLNFNRYKINQYNNVEEEI